MSAFRNIGILLGMSLLVLAYAPPAGDMPDQSAGAYEKVPDPLSLEDVLDQSIAAHGGLDTWRSYASLTFNIGEQRHVVDLHTRRMLQTSNKFEIGYDGEDMWVTPNMEAAPGNPRFLNGLQFYFFGLPFLLADPGTNRELLERQLVDGVEYDAVKITFDADVGASPDDFYVAHFDTETHQLRFLLYTVTYFSGEPNENYHGRMYDEWQEVGGLLLPAKTQSYSWDPEERSLGEMRGETDYSNVELGVEALDESLFAAPEGATMVPPADTDG